MIFLQDFYYYTHADRRLAAIQQIHSHKETGLFLNKFNLIFPILCYTVDNGFLSILPMSTYEESLDILSKLGIAREPNGSTKKHCIY